MGSSNFKKETDLEESEKLVLYDRIIKMPSIPTILFLNVIFHSRENESISRDIKYRKWASVTFLIFNEEYCEKI